jgi:hypothetical protein
LDDRPFVSLMFRVEAFDDVPCNVVVLFTTIVYGRHSRGAVTVVRLLGDEPIRCPLFRRGSFLGDGRDTLIRFSFWARVSFSGRRAAVFNLEY